MTPSGALCARSGSGGGIVAGAWSIGRSESPPVEGRARLGVRPLATADFRRVGRVSALLYLVSGASVLQIRFTAPDAVAFPGLYLLSGLFIVLVGALIWLIVRIASDLTVERIAAGTTLVVLFGSAAVIPVVLYFVGFKVGAVGSVVYVLPLIFGFWLLVRTIALALLAAIGLGHALFLSITDDVIAAPSQWLFLLAVLSAAGILIGGVVDEAARAAKAEFDARRALAEVNLSLEARVLEQVDELERLSRLRRFLSPHVADAVVSSGSDAFLVAHRREIAVFFCDLRGFTAFSAQVEPEEVVEVLNAYYEVIGNQVHKYEATVGAFAGDGIMAYLNDPNPCDRPAARAVEMALGLRDPMDELQEDWQRRGYQLGYGIGIAVGHATLGVIGFEGRHDYTPLGTVVNLASRLCDEAKPRQILVDRRVHLAVSGAIPTRPLADVALKGFAAPVPVYEVA